MDVLFTPEAMAGEVSVVYPGASIEPIPEIRKRKPTVAEVEELRTMIAEVLHEYSETQRGEALAVGCADPDAALLSLRSLREELRLNEKWLGRRYAHPREEPRQAIHDGEPVRLAGSVTKARTRPRFQTQSCK
jgi:hypothetical protein